MNQKRHASPVFRDKLFSRIEEERIYLKKESGGASLLDVGHFPVDVCPRRRLI
jgi:hypothetical protein